MTMFKINKTRQLFLLMALLLLNVLPGRGQDISLETIQSLDEWRWGVISYNDGLPGKALLAMERAVSLNPTDPLIREWLGRAYWRSGMEDAALEVWDRLAEENLAPSALRNRADQVRRRLSGEEEIPVEDEWIPLVSFSGFEDGIRYFERPSSARNLGDGSGSILVTSYAGGELVRLDANGTLVERYEGGLEGFDRPFDVLPTGDGRLLVSEFQADRISVVSLEGYQRGYRIDTWGESGLGDGAFLGPQYMALSPEGEFVYVSDWGNRRVSKWTLDGEHLLNLESGGRFGGFEGPSGVACDEDRVYVADSLRGTVDVFDPSGNYLGPLIETGLGEPEGLSLLDGHLLIADREKILKVDLKSGRLTLEASLGAGDHRITTVFPDENGNIAACDFNSDQIVMLTPLSTLYGGLDITLDRVRADAFPLIAADISVKDRKGHPISGLDASNFRVFDGTTSVGYPVLDWRSSEDSALSLVAVVDQSGSREDIRVLLQGLNDLVGSIDINDRLDVVGAGRNPVIRQFENTGGLELIEALLADPALERPVQWDEVLRLAAARITPDRRRKAVIAYVNRLPAGSAFDRYGLVETARLLANSGIVFYPVYRYQDARSRELDYIAEQTGGSASYIFRPEGSGMIARDLRRTGIGRYTVTWNSTRSSGYGRNYLPVSVEVIYINKSGRDESGTFAPLQ